MSIFDPDRFLSTPTEDSFETKYTPLPEDWYVGYVDKVEAGTTNNGAPFMRVTYKVLLEGNARELMGRDEMLVNQTIWLDLDDAGNLQVGPNKNVALGQLREAAGQNDRGKPWSPQQLVGAGPIKVYVVQRVDRDDPERKFNNIKTVAKA